MLFKKFFYIKLVLCDDVHNGIKSMASKVIASC